MEDAGDLSRSGPGSTGIRNLTTAAGEVNSTVAEKVDSSLCRSKGGTGQKPEWDSLPTETPS